MHYKPASTVSGDFYDFFETKGNNLGIVIGDVTGHGVEAGIVMGMAKTAINIYGRQIESPSEVMAAVNGPRDLRSNGLALGVDRGPKFRQILQEVSVQLNDGDIFFQYTDGLTEATNQQKEQYGEDRLKETIKRYGRLQLRELINIIGESLRDFTRVSEYEDDITMVALKVN